MMATIAINDGHGRGVCGEWRAARGGVVRGHKLPSGHVILTPFRHDLAKPERVRREAF